MALSTEQATEPLGLKILARTLFWPVGDFLVRYFHNAFHATRRLKDEWYSVIKAYKFTGFEILRFCIICLGYPYI